MTQERNDHWRKPYLGTKATQAAVGGTSASVQSGFLTQAGIHSGDLKITGAPVTLGPGTFGFFNHETGLSVNAASAEVTTGKMLYLANASFLPADVIGKHADGYQISNKSKNINPRYITAYERIDCAAPEAAVCHLGNTNFTKTTTLSITDPGAGYTDGEYSGVAVSGGTGTGLLVDVVIAGGIVVSVADSANGVGYTDNDTLTLDTLPDSAEPTTPAEFNLDEYGECNYEFYCGETYRLLVDIKGYPVLSVMNNLTPRYVTAFGGCCVSDSTEDEPIDSTLIFIQFAKGILESEYFKYFLSPIVYDQSQNPLFATADEAVAAGYLATDLWDNYVSPGYVEGALGGIRFTGAYVETQFGDCSFQATDGFSYEPVQISSITLADDTGNPCQKQLCFVCETKGYGGIGFGEEVLREFIDDAPRRGNMFSSDQRMREIEGGSELFKYIDRTLKYKRYIVRHEIPFKQNNEAGFSSENYELSIYNVCTATTTDFETFMAAWLTGGNNNTVTLKTVTHTPTVLVAI